MFRRNILPVYDGKRNQNTEISLTHGSSFRKLAYSMYDAQLTVTYFTRVRKGLGSNLGQDTNRG
jgi:hypothetical protein